MERDRPARATVVFTDSDGITASPSWHALALPEVCERLSATPAGLDAGEARRRLLALGPNELGRAHRVSPWPVLLAQFQNLLILILLTATAVSAYLGEVVEAIAIGVIVGFAILLGFVREYRRGARHRGPGGKWRRRWRVSSGAADRAGQVARTRRGLGCAFRSI